MIQPDPIVRTRWRHVGGSIIDCFGRTVPLADAIRQAQAWRAASEEAAAAGADRLAQVYARDALALEMPASLAFEWRRAAGWADPLAADGAVA